MLKIYITDIAAYNKGTLMGEWITLPIENDLLQKEVATILSNGAKYCAKEYGYEEHEEYFITDYEWDDVSLFDVDEYEDIYKLNEKLQLIEDADTQTLKAISFLLSEGIVKDFEDAISKADDVIIHTLTNMESIAYDLIQELYGADHNLPPIIANHIDYESIARDLELDGKYSVVGDDVYEYVG